MASACFRCLILLFSRRFGQLAWPHLPPLDQICLLVALLLDDRLDGSRDTFCLSP